MIVNEEVLQSILSDIPGDNPGGVNFKDSVRDLRPIRNDFNIAKSSARVLLNSIDTDKYDDCYADNEQNWGVFSKKVVSSLSTKSKDITLLGWLLCAQLYLDKSLRGFELSLQGIKELITNRWKYLQPSSTEDDKKHCENLHKALALWSGTDDYSCILYNPLCFIEIAPDITYMKYLSCEKEGNTSEIQNAVSQLDSEGRKSLEHKVDVLASCKNMLGAIGQLLEQEGNRLGVAMNNLHVPTQLVTQLLTTLIALSGYEPSCDENNVNHDQDDSVAENNSNAEKGTVKDSLSDANTSGQQAVSFGSNVFSAESAAEQPSGDGCSAGVTGDGITREQAFSQLRMLARYFRTKEPHSPVSYLIEKVIRWGYTPLPELLVEILASEKKDLQPLFNLIGVEKK